MNPQPGGQVRWHHRLQRWSAGAGIVVGFFGILGTAAWAMSDGTSGRRLTEFFAMAPITVLSFVLAGFSLATLRATDALPGARLMGQAGALAVVAVGLCVFWEYLAISNLGIDQLFFPTKLRTLAGSFPGRPAFLAAVNFCFSGAGLFILHQLGDRGKSWADLLTAFGLTICFLALIGYICGVPAFYGWSSLFPGISISLPCVIAFTLLGLGTLCAYPAVGLMQVLTSDTAGGQMARRLLLAPVIIPLVTGCLRIFGERHGFYNPEFGGWLFSFLNIFVFTLFWAVINEAPPNGAAPGRDTGSNL